MAYASDQFDWLTRTWAQELALALNGGTFDDYLDTEKVNDPDADPPVGPSEAYQIATAETANLVDNFMRECHQALEGVRAFRLRESGGPTALTIGAIADGQTVIRSGSSLVGASGVAPGTHAASHLPGGSDALTTGAPSTIGTANSAGSAAAFARQDHVHDIGTHASRHLPGGADALTTAAAVELTDSTNAEGAAASFARSNHTHSHGARGGGTLHADVVAAGASGFMSGSDKSKLDGISTGAGAGVVIYEVNFSTLANNTLTDGTEVVDGLNTTVANAAEMGTFRVQNASGIEMVTATSNGGAATMTSATQAAAYLYWRLDAFPGYNPAFDHIFEVYFSSVVTESTGEGPFIALWGAAASPRSTSVSRIRLAGLHRDAGGTRQLRATQTTTILDGDDGRGTHNVMAIRVNANGLGYAASGVWAAGWPTTLDAGLTLQVASAQADPFTHGAVRLVIGLASANDASPTTAVTFERLRVRRVA